MRLLSCGNKDFSNMSQVQRKSRHWAAFPHARKKKKKKKQQKTGSPKKHVSSKIHFLFPNSLGISIRQFKTFKISCI